MFSNPSGAFGAVTLPSRFTCGYGDGRRLILTIYGVAHKLGPSDLTNGLSTPNTRDTYLLLHMLGDLFRTQLKLSNPSVAFLGAVTSLCTENAGVAAAALHIGKDPTEVVKPLWGIWGFFIAPLLHTRGWRRSPAF